MFGGVCDRLVFYECGWIPKISALDTSIWGCEGGRGYDKIKVNDGDRHDTASGGSGGDWCIVEARSEAGTGCSRVTVR